MSTMSIRRAFETKLATLGPAIATAYENDGFTPTPGTPYQRVSLLPARPDNPQIGDKFVREQGVFQVQLCYPLGSGPKAAGDRAELVRSLFVRASAVSFAGVTATISSTPAVSAGFPDGDRWVVTVSVPYWANIYL